MPFAFDQFQDAPRPPPRTSKVPNFDLPPLDPQARGFQTAPAPPAPTSIGTVAPGVTARFPRSNVPPPPPPAPTCAPPPPPPPTTKTSSAVTPAGTTQLQVPVSLNSSIVKLPVSYW